jgi:hypothetical protein
MGCWITDKGLQLLNGIRSHYPSPEVEDRSEIR